MKTEIQKYQEKTLKQRETPRIVTIGNVTRRINGFVICQTTRKLNQFGLGYRRSCQDKPIEGQCLGSFRCPGGGGYFIRRLDNNKIIQVQSFHSKP